MSDGWQRDRSIRTISPREIPKGAAMPEPLAIPGPGGEISPQSIKQSAQDYLLRGQAALPAKTVGKNPAAAQQMRFRNAVQNYGNAEAQSLGMTPEELSETWQGASKLMQWMVGRDGQTTASLGTAYRHLNLLTELGDAYYNKAGSDFSQTWNRVKGKIAAEFGNKDITAADAGAQYSAGEIVKAIVGVGGGGVSERLGNEHNFKPGSGCQRSVSQQH